jgi:hypothetical protein
MTQTVEARIRQRRQQIAVHSYLYYVLNESIVSDHQWQAWADELVTLQSGFEGRVLFYDRYFFEWDGMTGYHLPKDDWIAAKATQVLRLHEAMKPATRAGKTPPAAAPQAPAAPPPQMSLF